MKSAKSRFKFDCRGFQKTLVLFPGWASDQRIFSGLNLDYNYLRAESFNPFNFKEALVSELDVLGIEKVSLFGWSQGGFAAAEFAGQCPQRVDELVLLGVKSRYDTEVLKSLESKLKTNTKVYLYKFYLECFSQEDKAALGWFRKHLLKDYVNGFTFDELKLGLDYLSTVVLNAGTFLETGKIKFFHGDKDKICGFNEALKLGVIFPKAEFSCLLGSGHLMFLHPRFRQVFYRDALTFRNE